MTEIFATSLMSGNIMFPGFATADNLLGVDSLEVAGEDVEAELQTRKNGPAPSNTHCLGCSGTGAQVGSLGWGLLAVRIRYFIKPPQEMWWCLKASASGDLGAIRPREKLELKGRVARCSWDSSQGLSTC